MYVLLIEDNEDDALLIRDALSRQTGDLSAVEWADRLETGLEHLARRPVDAVLVDLSLPDSQGLETVDRVRKHLHDAPVVVLTGLDDEAVAEMALRHGAQDYLVKGRLTGDALVRAIRYAVGRHHVEQALRKSEERFQLACRATRDAIWDWDIEADRLMWNETYHAIFGDESSEKPYNLTTWAERIHPDERAHILAELQSVLESTADLWTAEYRFLRSDGTYAHTFDRGYLVRGPHGRPQRMIGAMTDMTDRWQSDRQRAAQLAVTVALEESSSLSEAMPGLLRAICENTGWAFGCLWTVDAQHKHLRVEATWHNPALDAEALSNVYRSSTLGPGMGLAGQVWRVGAPMIQATITQDPSCPTAQAALQTGLQSASAFPIQRAGGVVGILEFLSRDVMRSDDRQLQMLVELGAKISQFLHRKDLERQLRQTTRMEALGRMAGGIAHDFNNLLTVINSWSELLLADDQTDAKVRRGLLQIKEAGDKAAGLTKQLLAFTRHQVVEPQVMNLNDRVLSIVELMQRVIGEDINLVVSLDPALGEVKADPGQIEQVVMNLVVNARDAMPSGGRLEVQTHSVSIDRPELFTNEQLEPGSYAALIVRDSGCGMDAETMAHIFEPFFTTKERGKGTGLGLATVYGIVKQSGGSVVVRSQPGLGTTFTVYLPQVGRQDTPPPVARTASPERQGTETILLVEDDDMVRGLAQTVLEHQDYNVLPARNAEEALELARDAVRHIDIVMTDMVLSGMNGSELAGRLQQGRPGMRVIVTSGYANGGQEFIGHLGSHAAFLQKPYTPETLTRKVREVLDAVHSASREHS